METTKISRLDDESPMTPFQKNHFRQITPRNILNYERLTSLNIVCNFSTLSGEYDERSAQVSCEKKFWFNLGDDEFKYMSGHVIDGKRIHFILIPLQVLSHLKMKSNFAFRPFFIFDHSNCGNNY